MKKDTHDDHLAADEADIALGQSDALDMAALWRTARVKRFVRPVLMGLPVIFIILAGLWIYATGGRWMQTQNAYIKADKAQIATQVSGTISALMVKDNQHVKAGDALFALDTARYQAALDAALAAHDEALGQTMAGQANYRQKLSEMKLARENLDFARRELQRRQALAKRKVVSASTLDEYVHDRDVAAARVQTKAQEIEVLHALLGDPEADPHEHPRVRGAAAKIDLAREDLRQAIVRAPVSGIAGAVPVVGDFVRAGVPVMVIVADTNMWVEANFKETALTYMRVGQKVRLKVDAYPDVEFNGHVASIDPATGAEFSLLPAQNASGNWVKVVQRVPVRIAIDQADDKRPLRAGMSVHVHVDTKHHRALPAVLRVPLRWVGADVG